MKWIALACLAAATFACAPPPPGPNEPPRTVVHETEEVTESCDSQSSENVSLSDGPGCLDGSDYEAPLSCTRECSGCDDQDCQVSCTGADDRPVDISACDPDEIFSR